MTYIDQGRTYVSMKSCDTVPSEYSFMYRIVKIKIIA